MDKVKDYGLFGKWSIETLACRSMRHIGRDCTGIFDIDVDCDDDESDVFFSISNNPGSIATYTTILLVIRFPDVEKPKFVVSCHNRTLFGSVKASRMENVLKDFEIYNTALTKYKKDRKMIADDVKKFLIENKLGQGYE